MIGRWTRQEDLPLLVDGRDMDKTLGQDDGWMLLLSLPLICVFSSFCIWWWWWKVRQAFWLAWHVLTDMGSRHLVCAARLEQGAFSHPSLSSVPTIPSPYLLPSLSPPSLSTTLNLTHSSLISLLWTVVVVD